MIILRQPWGRYYPYSVLEHLPEPEEPLTAYTVQSRLKPMLTAAVAVANRQRAS
jgi:hypothetical protein